MYKTNSRSRIMQYLQINRDHTVSVADIQDHLAKEQNPVNKTTIYRYLDKLEEEGDVIRYTDESGKKATYQFVDRAHHCDEHLHLKCLKCGRVIHLDCSFMDTIAEHIEEDHGFAIQCRSSVSYGYCEACRKTE